MAEYLLQNGAGIEAEDTVIESKFELDGSCT